MTKKELSPKTSNDLKWLPITILAIIGFFVLFIIIDYFSPSPSNSQPQFQKPKTSPTMTQVQIKTQNAETVAYITEVKPIVDQYEAEIAIIDNGEQNGEWGEDTNPTFQPFDDLYDSLANESDHIKPVPTAYKDYNEDLVKVLDTTKISADDITNPQSVFGYDSDSPCAWTLIYLAQDNFKIMHLANIEPIQNTSHTKYGTLPSDYFGKINVETNMDYKVNYSNLNDALETMRSKVGLAPVDLCEK